LQYTPQLGLGYAVLWWLVLEGIGLIVLPLTYRLFRHLPDRGYAFAKPLGLVLVTYLLWMGGTLGILRNTWGSILFVLLLVAVGSFWLYRRRHEGRELLAWLRDHRWTVLASEAVFTAAFVLWTAYKAYDPNIAITEKPMEFAFLNAIGRSEAFPAYDPWMSGYGISYYHFGYIMVATLAKFARVPGSFAFNLGIAMLFALTASGAFGVIYNLVHAVAARRTPQRALRLAIAYGLLAAVMIPLMGNLEGALEFLHANGVGVTVEEPGNVTGPFWEWLDIKNLTRGGSVSGTWYPTDSWWWWRASRLIHDKGLTGDAMEVIDEFPAFSFLLGDMHPHVLAYPFVFLVLALALNLLLANEPVPAEAWGLIYLCLGSLGFLNTWDMPFYLFVLVAAYGLNRYLHSDLDAPSSLERASDWLQARFLGGKRALSTPWLRQVVLRTIELTAASVLLYLPAWLYGLPKAGSGILPNLFNVSRFVHVLLMFGTFLIGLVTLLVARFAALRRQGRVDVPGLLRQGLPIWAVTMIAFPLILALVLIPVVVSPTVRTYIDDVLTNPQVQRFLGPQTLSSLLRISLRIRLGLLPPQLREARVPAGPWTFLILSLLIAAVVYWFLRTTFPRWHRSQANEIDPPLPSRQFAMLAAFTGLMLVFSVEFLYLRDAFGTRMNTVFKFYFQAWALLGLAGTYGIYEVMEDSRINRVGRALLGLLFAALIAAGLLYPLGASIGRTGGFAGPATLDGMAFVARERPEEYAAVQWLNANVSGHPVIVEAVRGSFAYEYARISSRTGLPAVIGWTGHEGQWHGLYDEIGERERDVNTLYAGSVQDALRIMEKYDVRYVVVGYLERAEFGPALSKFDRIMDVAFRSGDTVIYERRGG
jgi:YYY domain-containing protein